MEMTGYPNTIHDASLISMNFTLDKRNVVTALELKFLEETTNKPIRVFFKDVFEFQLGELTYQNIIYGADIYSGYEEITKFFQNDKSSQPYGKITEPFNFEMTVFTSSIGMNGFVIYKTKEIVV